MVRPLVNLAVPELTNSVFLVQQENNAITAYRKTS